MNTLAKLIDKNEECNERMVIKLIIIIFKMEKSFLFTNENHHSNKNYYYLTYLKVLLKTVCQVFAPSPTTNSSSFVQMVHYISSIFKNILFMGDSHATRAIGVRMT